MCMTACYAVFSDVDETLIQSKSMLDFARFYFVENQAKTQRLRELSELRARGVPRVELNRAYYRLYAGCSEEHVRALGRAWFETRARAANMFIVETRAALAAHSARGAELVLVSGSFAAILDPIAQAVAANALICTRPLVAAGQLTGEVERPMIGEHKADAIRTWLTQRPELDPERCYAYGDDASDLDMLECVGNPRVVGHDPVLRSYVSRVRQPCERC
jgi:HAD superfamily hydrolase (TIGR01490 family)